MRRKALAWLLIVACAGPMAAACTSATIHRSGGPDFEAQIVGGDRQHLYLRNEAGQTFAVPRSTVSDIDHPGNILMVAASPFLLVAAVLFLVPTQDECTTARCIDSRSVLRALGLGYGALGAGLLAGGAIPWFGSTGATGSDAGLPEGLKGDIEAMAGKPGARAAVTGASDTPPLAEAVTETAAPK